MRCHVCGATIGDVSGSSSDLPPVMDGWAWTVAADGSLDVVTCADCTKLMRPLVGPRSDQEPEYSNQVLWAVRYLVGQRFDAARAAGGRALRVWCDEAVAKPDYDARRSLVFGCLYGLDGVQLKKSLARLPGGAGSGCSNWKSRTSETDWAEEAKVVRPPLDVDGKLGPRTEDAVRQLQEAMNRAIPFPDEAKLSAWVKSMMPQDQHHASWAKLCDEAFQVLGETAAKVAAKAVSPLAYRNPVPSNPLPVHVAHESDGKLPIVAEAPAKAEISAERKCVHCGGWTRARYSENVPVPLCFSCAVQADAAVLPEPERESAVRLTAAGDRYAWQRLIEAQASFMEWEREDELVSARRLGREERRRVEAEKRRQRLREHPEKHLVKILGMADMFGPKVR